jgi:vacuolar-type H+-ATPase subunit H
MGRRRDQQQSDPVFTAIERVLRAERDGVQQLRHSEDEAQRLLTEARAGAAAIARRVDGCISKLHTAYLQKIQRDIESLASADPAQGAVAAPGYDRASLEAVARRVAAKLTGGA